MAKQSQNPISHRIGYSQNPLSTVVVSHFTCHNFHHPLEELGECERPVKLLGALVVLVGLGERRDPHGDRPVHVEEPDDEEAAPQDNPPENQNVSVFKYSRQKFYLEE